MFRSCFIKISTETLVSVQLNVGKETRLLFYCFTVEINKL